MSSLPIVGRLSYVGIAAQTTSGVPATQPTTSIAFEDIPDFLQFEYTDIKPGMGIREAMRDRLLTRVTAAASTSVKLSMDIFPLLLRGAFGSVSSVADKGIRGLTVTTPGTGYTSRPSLAVSGGAGAGGRVEVFMKVLAGSVTAGSGYTNGTYAITFTGGQVPLLPDGTVPQPATGTLTISGGAFTTVTITSGGSGYIEAPKASVTGAGAGTGGAMAITLAGDTAYITDRGQGYTSAPTITPTGGAGTGLVITPTVSTSTSAFVNTFTVRQSSDLPRLTFFVDYGPAGKFRISDVVIGKLSGDFVNEEVAMASVDMMGANVAEYNFTNTSLTSTTYFIKPQMSCVLATSVSALTTQNTTCSITSTTGSGFRGIPVISGGKIIDVQILSKGAGYDGGDTISFTGAGSGATATLDVVNGSINTITMTAEGTLYGDNPYYAPVEAYTFELNNNAENIFTAGTQNKSPAFIVAKQVEGVGSLSITMTDKVLRRWNLDNQPVAAMLTADNGTKVDATNGAYNSGFKLINDRVYLDTKLDGGIDDIRKVTADFTMTYNATNSRSVIMETYSTQDLTA